MKNITAKAHNATGEIDCIILGGNKESRAEIAKVMDKFIREMKKSKRKHRKKTATITDGFNHWKKRCPECGRMSMEVVRPGKAQCRYCG
jgi:hypothetical protein